MGGSQGARSLNFAAVEAFAEGEGPAARDFHVVQLAGRRDYAEMRARLEAAPHGERYTLLEYEPNLGDVLAACDLVVARSGGSIFEVTAAGGPRSSSPIPHATADHQTANARWMERAGAATVDRRRRADPGAAGGRGRARSSATRRGCEEMAAASRAMAKPDAARRIADEVLAAARADVPRDKRRGAMSWLTGRAAAALHRRSAAPG